MKIIWLVIFTVSLISLLWLIMRKPISRISLKKVIVHWIVAATFLFLLNYIEFTQVFAPSINPLTIGTTAVLGIPGLLLLLGVQNYQLI